MLRQVSTRNQRSKGGFKTMNVVQACLLIVICFWLVYQMKHSHEKKSYEERVSRDSSESEESQVESARFGRKVLPGLIESNPVRESHTERKDKENVKTIGQEIKHEENEDGKGGIGHHEINAQNQDRAEEKASLKEGITHAENQNGKVVASVVLEDQEHDEKSHEAREKSFRGDDASSEVFHNSEEPEQEAQERRFKGDDASSAVEHITESNESESAEDKSFKNDGSSSVLEHFTENKESKSENGARNLDEKSIENLARVNRETDDAPSVDSTAVSSDIELLDTFGGRNSSPSKGENNSLPNSMGTLNVTAHGAKEDLVPTLSEENSPSGTITKESDIAKEQYPEVKTTDIRRLIYPTNSVGNQTDIAIDSTDKSKDQFKLQMNSSALSQGQIHTETMSVNLTSSITYPQEELATSHRPQAQNDTIIIRIPGENFILQNNASDASDVPKKSDTSPNADEMVKSSRTPSPTNEDGTTVHLETSISSPTMDQKEAQGNNYPSNLQDFQNKVNFSKLEAAE